MSTPHENVPANQHDSHPAPGSESPRNQHAHHQNSSHDGPASPSSVLDILGTIEGQLDHLRKAQKMQDDQSVALTARQVALLQLERGLDESIQELRENRAALEADRQSLESDRHAFDAHWKQFTEQLNLEQQNLAQLRLEMQQEQSSFSQDRDEVRNLRAEQELAQQAWQEKMRQEQETLNQLSAELDDREKALNVRAQEVQAAQDRITLLQTQLQVQAEQLEQSKKEFESERAGVINKLAKAEADLASAAQRSEQLQSELGSAQNELKSIQQQFQSAQSELNEAHKRAQAAEKDFKNQLRESRKHADAVTADLESTRAERDSAKSSFDEAKHKLESLSKDIQAARKSLDERESTIAQQQAKLSSASNSIAKLSSLIQEQTPLIEQGAAAIALVPQQQEQIDRLTRQVAEVTVLADPALIAQKDQRIAELTDALREARGMSADAADLSEIHASNAALQQQVDALKLEAEHARVEAEEAQAQLIARAESVPSTAGSDARISEYEAKVQELTVAMDQLQMQSRTAIQQQAEQYEEQLRDLQNQIQLLQSESEEKLSSLSGEFSLSSETLREQHKADEHEITELRNRVHELQKKLQSTKAGPGNSRENEELSNKLKVKARKITAVAEHLKRRRIRLDRVKALLERKAAQKAKAAKPAGPSPDMRRAAQLQHDLEEQRRHLAEARRALAESEQEMVRKWAKPSSLIAVSLITLIALLLAGGSWFAADQFYPPTISASATIDAKVRSGKPTDEDLASWLAWNKAELSNSAFHKSLADRFEERHFVELEKPEAVEKLLTKSISVNESQSGRLVLSMTGPRNDQTFATLDIITGTLITEISRTANRTAETPASVSPDERRENGRTRYSIANPVVLLDPRPIKAAIIFGCAFGGFMLLISVFYVQLKRAKRIFDEQGADLAPAHVMGSK